MEKDDCRYIPSFGEDLFGGPDWKTMVTREVAADCSSRGTVPLLRAAGGRPLKRNFVQVDDLTDALLRTLDNPVTRGKTYDVAMDAPVDYAAPAAHLRATRGAAVGRHRMRVSFDMARQQPRQVRSGLAAGI